MLLFCLIFCWFFIQAPVSCGLDAMAFEKLKNTNFHVGLDSAAVAAMMATAAAEAVDDVCVYTLYSELTFCFVVCLLYNRMNGRGVVVSRRRWTEA